MGNTDDLDEHNAGLELEVMREYTTVFSLFRYCVVTAEATYLCNDLNVDCVPQPGYLLFEIAMNDVWVWDRNRPTRIIPSVQVFTTSDITVEQLKEVDDEDSSLEAVIPNSLIEQIRGIEQLAASDAGSTQPGTGGGLDESTPAAEGSERE